MIGRTHFLTGVTAGAVAVSAGSALDAFIPFWPTTDILARPIFVVIVAYCALLPDLDHPNSTVTYSLGPFTMFLSWALRGGPVGMFDFQVFPWYVEHRGVTHDARFGPAGFAVVLGLPTLMLPGWFGDNWWLWTWAVFLGCLTHIWGDARTMSGVPLGKRQIRIGHPFVTGSQDEDARREWIYRPAAVAAVVLAVVSTLYPVLT